MAHAGTVFDLGYPNGLVLSGPGASQTVYFPIPNGAAGATLKLYFAASAALNPHSSVTVLANGVPIATVLDSAAGKLASVAIPPAFTTGQFLEISFAADQTVDSDTRCYDNNGAATWSVILPDTAILASSKAPQGVGAVWHDFGAPLTISLPANPALSDIQTALILSTALVERGIAPYFGSASTTADIVIDPTAPDLAAGVQPGGQPQITVPNAGAASALVVADQALRAAGDSAATSAFTPNPAPTASTVTLGALGAGSSTITVARDASLNLALPFARLPAGRHVKSLILYGTGDALPPDESEIVSLEAGGNILWSQAFTGAVDLHGIQVDLPYPLIGAGAPVRLHIVRLRGETECQHFTPVQFTLRDNSALVLADGNPSPLRFAGFNVAGDTPVPVLTDLPPSSLAPALPLLSELLGAAGANPAAITVGSSDASGAPFILVSHQANSAITVAPIPVPSGPVTLKLPNQDSTVMLPDAGSTSILQLVSAGTADQRVPGLWLSPGPPASLAQAALPGDGNVAIYDGSSAPATFLTLLHDAQFSTPSRGFAADLLRNWSNELFAVFWLAITVLAVMVFVRRRRVRK